MWLSLKCVAGSRAAPLSVTLWTAGAMRSMNVSAPRSPAGNRRRVVERKVGGAGARKSVLARRLEVQVGLCARAPFMVPIHSVARGHCGRSTARSEILRVVPRAVDAPLAQSSENMLG